MEESTGRHDLNAERQAARRVAGDGGLAVDRFWVGLSRDGPTEKSSLDKSMENPIQIETQWVVVCHGKFKTFHVLGPFATKEEAEACENDPRRGSSAAWVIACETLDQFAEG